MMDVTLNLNMFETTFRHALATLQWQRNVLPRFTVFKSLAWAVTEPCASDQRFIRPDWIENCQSNEGYLELKSDPSTVSTTSLRTSSTDHLLAGAGGFLSSLIHRRRNFHRHAGSERLLFKLPNQMLTAQSIQEGHPSMSGDVLLDRSNKILVNQSRK